MSSAPGVRNAEDDLSYRSLFIDPVLFVRWAESTEEQDFDRLVKTIADARGAEARKVVFVGLIPKSNPLPDHETRRRMTDAIEEVWPHCASIHLVIEGEGMRRALVRSVIAGLLLVIMKRSRRMSVHVDAEEALTEAAKTSRIDVPAVLARARTLGILAEPAR